MRANLFQILFINSTNDDITNYKIQRNDSIRKAYILKNYIQFSKTHPHDYYYQQIHNNMCGIYAYQNRYIEALQSLIDPLVDVTVTTNYLQIVTNILKQFDTAKQVIKDNKLIIYQPSYTILFIIY